ncbi:hypothetical protein EDD18DRAFT_1061997, partial [Armillaria luteobubalina]
EIPLWYHSGFKKGWWKCYGSKVHQCLMDNHGIEIAGEAMDMAARLETPVHRTRKDCKCSSCGNDRAQTRCTNPHKCAWMAKKMLNHINKKWDP